VRSLVASPLLLCAACTFRFTGLPIDDGSDLAVPAGDDLAITASNDLAAGDPCGPSFTPQPGTLAIKCAIGASLMLDGNLAEWGALDYSLTHANAQGQSSGATWTGVPAQDDADSSAQFSLRWDQSYLWVAMHVADDIRGVHPGAPMYEPYLDDAVELYLDGLHDRTTTYGTDDHQFVVTADNHNGEFKNGQPVGVVPAADYAVQPDAVGAGFSVEFRVPWSVLGGAAAANGRAIGVDLEVDDDDNVTIQELTRYLMWWNMASTGCGYPSACTTNFGVAQLVGR
jgi:cellulose/xylan binding protein with CBM9 domain